MKKRNSRSARAWAYYEVYLHDLNRELVESGAEPIQAVNVEEWVEKYQQPNFLLAEALRGQPSDEKLAFRELSVRITFYENVIGYLDSKVQEIDRRNSERSTKNRLAAQASAEVRGESKRQNEDEIVRRWAALESKKWPVRGRAKFIYLEMLEEAKASNRKSVSLRTVQEVVSQLKTK